MKVLVLLVCLSVCYSVSAMWGPAALLRGSGSDDPSCTVCKNMYEGIAKFRSHGMSEKDIQDALFTMGCGDMKDCKEMVKKLTDKIFEQMKDGKRADEGCKNIYGMCK